jgi:hypothetical protein
MIGERNINLKLGVLLFDEMEIQRKYEYFQKNDSVFAAHKKVQVLMLYNFLHPSLIPVCNKLECLSWKAFPSYSKVCDYSSSLPKMEI